MSKIAWKISGDMVLSCNCDVFCPCVASLGKARPTYGYCQAWGALKINKGFVGEETLDGLNLAFMLDIPGRMSEGNWTSAIYVDERANETVAEQLAAIMRGELGGPPTVLGILVGNVIGVKKVPISIKQEGSNWTVEIPKIIKGIIGTMKGSDPDSDVVITNTNYWIAPDVHIAQSGKNKFRDFGRNWEFTGQSAEYMQVEWAA